MRMRKCPHCGAENSVKRTVCYRCRRPLATEAAQEPAPRSRWEALEPARQRGQHAVWHERPEEGSPRGGPPPARREPRRRAGLPGTRGRLGQVRDMGVFFRELEDMASSGIAVGAACREMARRAPRRLRVLAQEMAAAVEAGQPISSALESHQELLYPWHLGVIRAAEAGGFLPEAFDQIAHAYEVEWETRSAMRLRLFVYSFLGLPAVLLFIPVVRMLTQPIPEQGWTPRAVLETLAQQALSVSVPIALALVASVVVWQLLGTMLWFQRVQQRIVLRLPIVGKVARAAALQRYLASLGLLLRGGIPVSQAAEEAAVAAGNVDLTPKLLALAPRLREGEPMSQLLAETRLFDPDTVGLASSGEASGSLPEMLTRAARYYREEGEAKRKMLIRAAQIGSGVVWALFAGALVLLGFRAYFEFVFRVESWMSGEDLEGINW